MKIDNYLTIMRTNFKGYKRHRDIRKSHKILQKAGDLRTVFSRVNQCQMSWRGPHKWKAMGTPSPCAEAEPGQWTVRYSNHGSAGVTHSKGPLGTTKKALVSAVQARVSL